MLFLIFGIIGIILGVVILVALCNFAVNTHRHNKIANFTGITKESAPIQEDLKKISASFKIKLNKFAKNLRENKLIPNAKSKVKLLIEIAKTTKNPKEIVAKLKESFAKKPNLEKPNTSILELPFTPIFEKQEIVFETIKPSETATIDMLSGSEKQPISAFEKKETRIYQKIQENGIEDYATWMELGTLYESELEYKIRAKEVYAFVLKQAKGDIKERAKNKLVSL